MKLSEEEEEHEGPVERESQQGQQAEASSGDESDDAWFADWVYMALLSSNMREVVMLSSGGQWGLPWFYYPKSMNDRVSICCKDLQEALGISSSKTFFTVRYEALGKVDDMRDGVAGYVSLMIVENHLEDLKLPDGAAWVDADFVASLPKDADEYSPRNLVLTVLIELLKFPDRHAVNNKDPRARHGWFGEAVAWMTHVLHDIDRDVEDAVLQYEVNLTSTLLKARTKEGNVFLKSPTIACREPTITSALCSLFPDTVPQVLGVNDRLHAFISEGFEHKDLDTSYCPRILMTMGRLQLASLDLREVLEAARCQDRGVDQLALKIEEWKEDSIVERTLGRAGFSEFRGMAQTLIDLCNRLGEHKLPSTIVHGDLSRHNCTFRKNKVDELLIFDWQYSCISHPFFDLMEMERELSEESIDDYLKLWLEYGSLSRLRKACDLALRLAWCLKLWDVFETIKLALPRGSHSLEDYAYVCLNRIKDRIKKPLDRG